MFMSMSELDVWQVMEMLDRLYRLFDELTQKYNLFKVETIGDAYMTVANLRCPQQDHAALVARFAIEAVQAANSVMIRSDDSTSGFLSIRAGGQPWQTLSGFTAKLVGYCPVRSCNNACLSSLPSCVRAFHPPPLPSPSPLSF